MAQQYGKWRVKEQIGQGGQGTALLVYDVNDPEKKPFVLKRLSNLKRLSRFEKEVRAGLQLSHPNILKIVDKDLEHDSPYFVAEYCPGGALNVDALSQLSITDRLRMHSAICRAVGHAHSKGFIHRDIKPANIFLRGDMTPVVGDFGICFITEDGDRVTMLDEQVGSRWYMAPELAHGIADEVTPAADVYSLGKVLYWMLAGRIFDREVHESPRFDLRRDQTAPDYFFIYDLFKEIIVEDPKKRLPHANEVADAVDVIIRRIEMGAHHLDLSTPQDCLYCGIGFYKVVVDEPEKENVYPMEYRKTRLFGLNQEGYSGPVSWWPKWLILACDHCGNVQTFRPDLAKNRDVWKKD